ncbi:hypothetical protein [uncultured Streptomyces sp.]|uniref:hypothetical protein n=1 Tax=uncultured Streptomyces sp. TaxID=174707 RepID=UPI0026169FC9|nr:hypothetical protein [uncultured Streptomyces sp.]
MIPSDALAPSADIRAHFVHRLNMALRRPSLWGDEAVLQLMCEDLLYVEGRAGAWAEQRAEWEARGAWSPLGAKGAFTRHLHLQGHEYAVASLYAELAHRAGWLRADRLLTGDEYARLRATVRDWTVERDRDWTDVTTAFGPPSVRFGGSDPRYGKALGYATADPADPVVTFHLWNGTAPGAAYTWPPEHTQPVLLATRWGSGPFPQSFAFTPEGERQRPAVSETVSLFD